MNMRARLRSGWKRGLRPMAFLVLDRLRRHVMTRAWTALFRMQCLARGIRAGQGLEVYGRVLLVCAGDGISIGNRVQLISSSWRSSFSALWSPVRLVTFNPSARIEIADDVGLNGTSITCRSQTIRIGRGTMVGPNCTIVDSSFHKPWPAESRRYYPGTAFDAGVDIGENVWIGAQCMILKGVKIGKNAVIAAGSVVSVSVPANALARGNPAKVVHVVEDDAIPPGS